MRGKAEILKPEEVEISITLIGKTSEWESVLKDLGQHFPAIEVAAVIRDAIYQVKQKVFAMPVSEQR